MNPLVKETKKKTPFQVGWNFKTNFTQSKNR